MKEYKDMIAGNIPYLRRYASALSGDSDLADRLVYECIDCAMDLSHLLKEQSHVDMKQWLFTVFHNLYNGSNREEIPESDHTHDSTVRGDQNKENLTHAYNNDSYHLAIKRLPLNQRQTFLLAALEQFSYKSVSRILNIPLGAVLSQLHSARKFIIENTNEVAFGQAPDNSNEGRDTADAELEISL